MWFCVQEEVPFREPKIADIILEDFDDVSTRLDITHFLYRGTCLGLYRDGTYPEVDKDIDVGIICSDEQKEKLFKELENNGYMRWTGEHFIKYHLLLNIYTAQHREVTPFEGFLKKFDTITYKGRTYNVPHPIEEYLRQQFGVDWRKPKAYHAGGILSYKPLVTEKEDAYLLDGEPRLAAILNPYLKKKQYVVVIPKGGRMVKLACFPLPEDQIGNAKNLLKKAGVSETRLP